MRTKFILDTAMAAHQRDETHSLGMSKHEHKKLFFNKSEADFEDTDNSLHCIQNECMDSFTLEIKIGAKSVSSYPLSHAIAHDYTTNMTTRRNGQ